MVSNLVLENLTEEVDKLYKTPTQEWVDDTVTEHDKKILKTEAEQESPFDKLNLKRNLNNSLNQGNAHTIVKRNGGARVVILRENKNQNEEYPWGIWARIFQWFGNPKDGGIWQIYLYSSDVKRVLPSDGPIGAEHLNGGYTYPCRGDCIVIYRYEEATRVLVHELLHAACTDDQNKQVELREAATEAWAELFLVALMSKGSAKKAHQLWKVQDHYIQDLNYTVRNFHHVNKPEDYGSRYTILREDVFKQFGVKLDPNYKPKRVTISRFTTPELDKYLV